LRRGDLVLEDAKSLEEQWPWRSGWTVRGRVYIHVYNNKGIEMDGVNGVEYGGIRRRRLAAPSKSYPTLSPFLLSTHLLHFPLYNLP
jgi:hypothetical protein